MQMAQEGGGGGAELLQLTALSWGEGPWGAVTQASELGALTGCWCLEQRKAA